MPALDAASRGLAAEFALGSLPANEQAEAELLLASNAEFAEEVRFWRNQLSTLAAELPPVAPRAELRARILARVAPGAVAANDNVVALKRSLASWRAFGLAASAIAAGLAAFVVLRPAPNALPDGQRYVAVLQSEGPGPAFVASVDLARGTISVRTVSATPPAGKSYELWAIGAGRAKPQSLGVINADYRLPLNELGKTDAGALGDTLFAVTVEQQGGSPTGEPTSAPVFTGKLIATE